MARLDSLLLRVAFACLGLAGAGAPVTARAEARAVSARGRLGPADANTCLTCHRTLADKKLRAVAEEFAESVHRDDRIGCVACHGGAPTDPTVTAHAPEAGFVAKPPQARIAEICGGCHENPVFIRHFDSRLPVDQRKLFELSRHGNLANAGDTRAPTCTTCHGTHAIRPVASPEAPVNRSRVLTLCGGCHADPARMAPFGIAPLQVEQWKRSVHGVAFLGGNHAAPTCTSCHSPHAGKLPGSAAIESLCDRCHADERDLFLVSPHAKAFQRLGLGECLPCHGSHAVAPARGLLGMGPDSACGRCHAKDPRPREIAGQLAGLLASVDALDDAASAALASARGEGLYLPGAAHALDRVRTARLDLSTRVHALSVARVTEGVRAARPIVEEVRGLVARARGERAYERRGYFVALAVAVLLLGLLILKSVRLSRRRSRGA